MEQQREQGIERSGELDPRFAEELWELLADRARRYTMGESTSLPVEQVQELSESVRFCMELYAAASGSSLAALSAGASARELYERGQKEVLRQVGTARALYHAVAGRLPAWASRSLRDTVDDLGGFFTRYDPVFFAHQIPCMVDYQLGREVEDARGVAWVREYLRRLGVELRFCAALKQPRVPACLEADIPHYRDQVLNLYEPLAERALCRALAGLDPSVPVLSGMQRQALRERLEPLPPAAFPALLREAAGRVCDALGIEGAEARAYHARTAQGYAARLAVAAARGALDGALPAAEKRPPPAAPRFVDGPRMDPGRLRELAGRLRECATADKVAGARRETHSLRDLAELLGLLFWGAECREVFAGLEPPELAYLCRLAARSGSMTGWERELERYMAEPRPDASKG